MSQDKILSHRIEQCLLSIMSDTSALDKAEGIVAGVVQSPMQISILPQRNSADRSVRNQKQTLRAVAERLGKLGRNRDAEHVKEWVAMAPNAPKGRLAWHYDEWFRELPYIQSFLLDGCVLPRNAKPKPRRQEDQISEPWNDPRFPDRISTFLEKLAELGPSAAKTLRAKISFDPAVLWSKQYKRWRRELNQLCSRKGGVYSPKFPMKTQKADSKQLRSV